MRHFTTTRGGPPVSFEEAVLRGLPPDGGLYVPLRLPAFRWPPPDRIPGGGDDLRHVARWAAPLLFPSLSEPALRRVVEGALDFPVPIAEVEPGIWVLELFHGPTHAFKDVGARFMALLMAELDGGGDHRTVLVATSGDTGGAVANAFHGLTGYSVVALFPKDGISERQRRQMTTLGDNVHALAVEGTFDDCQRMVKDAFADQESSMRHGLTSANSINVARLLPQTLYYLHAAHAVRDPLFVVPCGNLGNLCAGLMASRGGMPASGFLAATNENRAFVDYLDGDDFQARPSVSTTSSAMDVGAPSNLERVRWLYDDDDAAVRRAVKGAAVEEDEVVACISGLHDRTGYVADPHTAVAYAAALRRDVDPDEPTVVLATAHPSKFPETVEQAIGEEIPPAPGLHAALEGEERMTTIAADVTVLTEVLGGLTT